MKTRARVSGDHLRATILKPRLQTAPKEKARRERDGFHSARLEIQSPDDCIPSVSSMAKKKKKAQRKAHHKNNNIASPGVSTVYKLKAYNCFTLKENQRLAPPSVKRINVRRNPRRVSLSNYSSAASPTDVPDASFLTTRHYDHRRSNKHSTYIYSYYIYILMGAL